MRKKLRCVVLDNDETTGAYRIIIAFLYALQQVPTLTLEELLVILERLAECMMRFQLFRPGIQILLKTVVQLRKCNLIDGVVMYTNQKESIPDKASLPLLYSPPQVIAYMMAHITNDLVFDKIIARTSDKIYPKSFELILSCFEHVKEDIRHIVFVDDNAVPSYIQARTIPIEKQSPTSWYRIKPYYRILSADEFVECLSVCFEGTSVSLDLQETIMGYYYANEIETSDIKDDSELIRLAEYLLQFYQSI